MNQNGPSIPRLVTAALGALQPEEYMDEKDLHEIVQLNYRGNRQKNATSLPGTIALGSFRAILSEMKRTNRVERNAGRIRLKR